MSIAPRTTPCLHCGHDPREESTRLARMMNRGPNVPTHWALRRGTRFFASLDAAKKMAPVWKDFAGAYLFTSRREATEIQKLCDGAEIVPARVELLDLDAGAKERP